MATYKKQLLDKDGNVIYPDVGLDLDKVVYSDDPTEPLGDVTPWIEAEDIIWSTMIDKIYPVGAIFMSATLSTPSAVSNALGGTWVAWGAGRVPVGVDTSDTAFDTAEETGGNKNYTLLESNLPNSSVIRSNVWVQGASCDTDNTPYSSGWANGSIGDSGHTNSQPFSIVQPYITCYMYKRTA